MSTLTSGASTSTEQSHSDVCNGVSMGRALLARIPLLFIVAITYRLRYYFAWAVSESSLIFSGLSYEGTDPATGRPGWDRCINARIEKVNHHWIRKLKLNFDRLAQFRC